MSKKVFIIAGEPSGDLLGSFLIRAMKKENPDLQIKGVGGDLMEEEGIKSLIPLEDIAVMGLFEVIPHILKIKNYIKLIKNFILEWQPDIIVTIDAPSFNFRIIKKVKKVLSIPCIHYVAPSVWAWRPKRAQKIAKLYDHLLCLLPFEPKYFENIKTTFVGHPINEYLETKKTKSSKQAQKTIALLPGSRKTEIKKHLPIFMDAIKNLNLRIIILTLPHLKDWIKTVINKPYLNYKIITENRFEALKNTDIALAASGTISLELAKAKVPCLIAYRVSPITAYFARKLIKVKFVSIINLLFNKEIIPEYLQKNCSTEKLEQGIKNLLANEQSEMLLGYKKGLALLKPRGKKPSELAAKTILKYL